MATHTASDEITALSLFTGAGMLDVAVELAFGPIFRPIAYVECEAYAAAVLAAAMGQGRIHPAPIWSDARTVCRPQFRHYVRTCLGAERLGAVIAGYPCPDFSVAGKREGTRGAKGSLWWNLAEAIAEFEPQLLFLENVGGHTSRGFDTVCSSLQEMGYRIASGLFTASETGASHRRERLFILARLNQGERPGGPSVDRPVPGHGSDIDAVMGDAERAQRRPDDERGGCCSEGGDGCREKTSPPRVTDKTLGGAPGDNRRRGVGRTEKGTRPDRFRCRIQTGPATTEFCRTQLPVYPPGPGDLDAWRRILSVAPEFEPAIPPDRTGILAAARRAYRLVAPGINRRARGKASKAAFESFVCGMADGMAERTRRLRLSGNGVVPLEAAYAYITLAADLFDAGS